MNETKEYDFLIIGSGLAGLASAIVLAKHGYSVCVLEKNRQFGGNLQVFSRDKCVFDTGVHYIGSLDKGQVLHKYFSYLGIINDLKLLRMDEKGFDIISFQNESIQYPHAMGHSQFIEALATLFPDNRTELTNYVKKIREVCESISLYSLKESDDHMIPSEYLSTSAFDFIQQTISNPKLQQILAGSNMLYAGIKDQTTLYQHAVIQNSYIESAWKCIDGGSQITKALVKKIKSLGGELHNYTEVEKIHIENKIAVRVDTVDGRIFKAKYFISNIHPALTMDMIGQGDIKESFRNRLVNLENGISAFSIYLVFKPNSFPYLNKNYYHHFTNDVWAAVNYSEQEWPLSIMAILSATSHSQQFADSMTVWTYMKWDEVKKWSHTFNTIPKQESERGEDYQIFKQAKTEQLLASVEKLFPGIRDSIKSIHASTPLSYRDYINTPDGSMYGVIKDYNHPLTTFISPKTKIDNLFLTGQNLSTHGILGVTISAFNTCAEFIDKNALIKEVNQVIS